MSDDDSTPRGRADAHFKGLRADKVTSEFKRVDTERVKADADKTARLRAARIAKEDAGGPAQTAANVCRKCKGSGRIGGSQCPECSGTGQVAEIVGDA